MNKLHGILGLAILLTASVSCEGGLGGCVDDSPCGVVSVLDDGDGYCEETTRPAPLGVTSEKVAKCVLEALRDGTKGPLTINQKPVKNNGYCHMERRIQILDDRAAVVAEGGYADLGGSTKFRAAGLKSAEEYQKCLDDGPSAYPACLADPVVYRSGEPDCGCDYCEPLFENE